MKVAIEPLFGVLLAQQSERANALDDVVFPAVGRGGVVNWKGAKSWKMTNDE